MFEKCFERSDEKTNMVCETSLKGNRDYFETILSNWQKAYIPWNPNKTNILFDLCDRIEAINGLM